VSGDHESLATGTSVGRALSSTLRAEVGSPDACAETPGSNQYDTISGLASAAVARLRLYLGNGQTEPVPLHDNGYIVEAPTTAYPLRLVAYDRQGQAIGIVTLSARTPLIAFHNKLRVKQPAPNAHWQLIIKRGVTYVFAAPATGGGTCFAVTALQGGGSMGCQPPLAPAALQTGSEGNAKSVRVTIFAGSAITHVTIHFASGRTQTVGTTHGVALVTIPATGPGFGLLPLLADITEYTGQNADGRVVAVLGTGRINSLTPTRITVKASLAHSTKPVTISCSLPPASQRHGPAFSNGRTFRKGEQVQILCSQGQAARINLDGPP
jgi:hypothetical protein